MSFSSPIRGRNSGLALAAIFLVLVLVGRVAVAAAGGDHHTSLYVINADGSGIRLLHDEPNYGLWGPAWSPDGSRIAVSFVQRDRSELYLLDENGQNPRPLTHNGRNNYYPSWSHDGRRLVFISQQGSDVQTSEISVINADGSNEQQLTHNTDWDYGASWSPDDRQIAFGSSMGGNWQIWLMNSDGSNQHPLPERATGNAPAWSPDGRLMLYKSDREGNDNIYVMSPDGSDQRRLTNDKSINNNPGWSPDGSKIVFWSTRSGTANFYVMNPDGSDVVNLINNPGLDTELPSWSPDGKRILFHASTVDTGPVAFIRENIRWLVGADVLVLLGIVALAIVLWRRRSRDASVGV